MSNEQQAKHIPCDRSLAQRFVNLIDGTDFGTVKQYRQSPQTPIEEVLLLKAGYRLEELAAAVLHGNPRLWWELVVNQKVATIASDDNGVWRAGYHQRLDSIPDAQPCQVIYLPPVYLVQLQSH